MFGIDNVGKIFLLFMVSLSIMIISARAGASGTQLSKIHAAHSLGASRWQILREVIFQTHFLKFAGIRVAVGMCWGTLVAAEFLAGTTGIGFVENVARKYMQYEVIWITIFVMGMLGLLFDITIRKIIDKTIRGEVKDNEKKKNIRMVRSNNSNNLFTFSSNEYRCRVFWFHIIIDFCDFNRSLGIYWET